MEWTPAAERGVTSYRVAYGPPGAPPVGTITVREPRAAIALAALSGVVRVESVLGALHKRGRGI